MVCFWRCWSFFNRILSIFDTVNGFLLIFGLILDFFKSHFLPFLAPAGDPAPAGANKIRSGSGRRIKKAAPAHH